jgi:hypothetical protein
MQKIPISVFFYGKKIEIDVYLGHLAESCGYMAGSCAQQIYSLPLHDAKNTCK